jgi:RNA polymerase sigma-70 factor (ECF subfamily)
MTPEGTDQQDRDDMARLCAGHDAGLNSLMSRHAGRLFNYLLRQLADESDAADLAQETFVRVYQNRARFNPAQKFSTWLYAIATNLLRDRFRWRRRHPEASLDAESEQGSSLLDRVAQQETSPLEHLAAEERAAEVRKAVESLPEELRTPLILSQYEDLPHAEIGSILKCSAKAVETRLYRARAQLRKRLERVLAES